MASYSGTGQGLSLAEQVLRATSLSSGGQPQPIRTYEKEFKEATALLVEVCGSYDKLPGHSRVIAFKGQPKLREWWEKRLEKIRVQEEKEDKIFNIDLGLVLEWKESLRHYMSFLMDKKLDQSDLDYFQKKMTQLNEKINLKYERHSGLRSVVTSKIEKTTEEAKKLLK